MFRPVVNVQLIHRHAQTQRFEAIVDTGSPYCFFHSSIGRAIGIKIEDGVEGPLGGVIGGARGKVFYHKVKLKVAAEIIEITGGFSDELSVGALLGDNGFLNNFILTFDPTPHPPCFEFQRIHRN